MNNVGNGKLYRSALLNLALSRFSKKIAPLVQAQLVTTLVAELERHFNETLLPELYQRVEGILSRELPKCVGEISAKDLPRLVEDIVDRSMQVKSAYNPLIGFQLYLPNDIVSGSMLGEYMVSSNPRACDFLHIEYKEFCRLYNEPVLMHRKQWEYAFIYERLRKAGMLAPGMRGLGFGVGTEGLPSLFASLGARITATDAPVDVAGDWAASGVYSSNKDQLFRAYTISRELFDDRVSFENCDMNDIPTHLTDFDFCWSSCAFEHLGSLEHGIDFVINSIERVLKVGGVACHTTELNLSSDNETIETGDTVIYRKKDLERLSGMLKERGHWVEPLRIETGGLLPDYLVDIPPYRRNPHLKLLNGQYVATSVGVVARRGR